MKKINLHKSTIILIIPAFIYLFTFIAGCDDSGVTENNTEINNPDVTVFDSLWVEETIDATSLCGLNLFYGSTVPRDSISKDVQLIDSLGSGVNFYLRSGDLSDFNLPIGFKTRFNRLYTDFTKERFDTITVLPVNRDTILPELDFTADETSTWEYFNDSLSGNQAVYSFYLEGKSINFHGRNIYGIIQAIGAFDTNPGNIGGYYMTFRARINFTGKNDFRQRIKQNN